jgi:hypothetical protein
MIPSGDIKILIQLLIAWYTIDIFDTYKQMHCLYINDNYIEDKLKITMIKDKIFFGENLHHPSITPSHNFFGSS